MPMQPPPSAAGTMTQPPNSMVGPPGPQMAYGMPPPVSGTSSTTDANSVPSTTFNMASMGATLPHPGGQQPPVFQTAPQGKYHNRFFFTKGASTYYVTSILANLDPLPPVIMCHHF